MPERRYFVDANIIVSGLMWRGNERRLLELGESGELSLVSSQYVIHEASDALARLGFAKEKIIVGMFYIGNFIEIIEIDKEDVKPFSGIVSDKSDAPVLAAAAKAKAILITGDKNLRKDSKKHVNTMISTEVLAQF